MAPDLAQRIHHLSLLLALVAGFCDTTTFVAADTLFSAHVTGNFIVFAYDVVQHVDQQAWVKLVSFPVFVAAVALARLLGGRAENRYALLLWESGLLLLAAGLVLAWPGPRPAALVPGAALLVVAAMALQNAFGRLYAKETYGPTTVMTGNVTQATLDALGLLATAQPAPAEAETALRRQGLVLVAFLVGCLVGAVAARWGGLAVVAVPGLLLPLRVLGYHRQARRTAGAPAN